MCLSRILPVPVKINIVAARHIRTFECYRFLFPLSDALLLRRDLVSSYTFKTETKVRIMSNHVLILLERIKFRYSPFI